MTRSACINAIYDLAKRDERVIFIGSDLTANLLPEFKKNFPHRYMMEGIMEQQIIGMAAGLAMEGFIPYVVTIATFLTRRCYEQIAIDVCAHDLPVRLIGYGGGLVYTPLGLTHCAIEDMAIMRALPNMQVVCCSDNEEMTAFMQTTLDNPHPIYIRLGKDSDPKPESYLKYDVYSDVFILSTGIMTDKANIVAKLLKLRGISCGLQHIAQIKPLERGIPFSQRFKLIVTMEEGVRNGGLGTAVLEALADDGIRTPILRFGLPDAFPHHYGEQQDLLETYELTPEKMAEKIKEFYDGL